MSIHRQSFFAVCLNYLVGFPFSFPAFKEPIFADLAIWAGLNVVTASLLGPMKVGTRMFLTLFQKCVSTPTTLWMTC